MKKTFLFILSYLILSPFSLAQEPPPAKLLTIPTNKKSHWLEVKFDNLPANKVHFQQNGLIINVKNSASPLIYPFPETRTIKQIKFKAQLKGQLHIPKDKTQGDKGADDFILRIGLVKQGKKTLSPWKKLLASKWVLKLFELAPSGSGIENIEFLNIPNNIQLTGTTRTHPLSDLIQETFLTPVDKNGLIEAHYTFSNPISTLALWLSIDGDDTHSEYQIHISEITLNPHLQNHSLSL